MRLTVNDFIGRHLPPLSAPIITASLVLCRTITIGYLRALEMFGSCKPGSQRTAVPTQSELRGDGGEENLPV